MKASTSMDSCRSNGNSRTSSAISPPDHREYNGNERGWRAHGYLRDIGVPAMVIGKALRTPRR
jgi:hypothetical protein